MGPLRRVSITSSEHNAETNQPLGRPPRPQLIKPSKIITPSLKPTIETKPVDINKINEGAAPIVKRKLVVSHPTEKKTAEDNKKPKLTDVGSGTSRRASETTNELKKSDNEKTSKKNKSDSHTKNIKSNTDKQDKQQATTNPAT